MKKKSAYLFLLFAISIFTSCDTNDDGFYNTVYIDASNLVTFSNQTNYSTGDYFYVQGVIPRLLPEVGQTTPVDIYKTTNGATKIAFSYVIERRVNATDWEVVSVNDNQLDIEEGSAQNGAYVYGLCLYNSTNQVYNYRVGFPLTAIGNYRVSFGYNSSSTNSVELRSLSEPKNLVAYIDSSINNLDSSGYFYFNVN